MIFSHLIGSESFLSVYSTVGKSESKVLRIRNKTRSWIKKKEASSLVQNSTETRDEGK